MFFKKIIKNVPFDLITVKNVYYISKTTTTATVKKNKSIKWKNANKNIVDNECKMKKPGRKNQLSVSVSLFVCISICLYIKLTMTQDMCVDYMIII